MKNETTNERLRALESSINMPPVDVLVKTGCSAMENSDRTTLNPIKRRICEESLKENSKTG